MRRCAFVMPGERPCGAAPLRDSTFCRLHDPEKAEEVAEGRRLGGIRRRRERTLAGAYDLGGVRTIDDLIRITEIVVFDVIGMENGIAKARVLLQAVMAGAKLIEVGDLTARVAALEARDADHDPGR